MNLTTRFDREGFTGSLDLTTTPNMHSFVSDHREEVEILIHNALDALAADLRALKLATKSSHV